MKPLWRASSFTIQALFLFALLLLLYSPFKAGIISFQKISANKDLIDAISSILGILGIFIGGTLAYIRFFKGRILSPKVDLEIQSGVLLQKRSKSHWIEISITNRGNVTLWNYQIFIYLRPHPLGNRIEYSDCVIPSSHEHGEKLVDVGETAFEHAVIEVQEVYSVFTFEVIVVDSSNTIWRRCLTVSNS
ncbi:hypothetical protein [Leptothoe kymatousa]|uniref:DUF1616 domain-containing protein n=1 Tax=Leptothoe kymatousa TAU-MAC 1615 TaxID=2364775 RepID=A0ABS5Y3Y5_9CYAN|nr:hypothetical protein [Leptothoe kymatousa]MBT9312540.1 hypothetical protein [Leptothoe kymatousa TAU-MAC 1615]